MKKQFIWKGHEVKIVNTWVDDDNRKKGVMKSEQKKAERILGLFQFRPFCSGDLLFYRHWASYAVHIFILGLRLRWAYWALYTDRFFFFFFHWTTCKTHIAQGVSSIGLIKSPIPHFRSPQFGVACGSCCRPAIKRLRQIHVIYVLAQAESSLAGWNCESLGFGGAPWCYGNRLTRWFVTVEKGNTICWALNVDHFIFWTFAAVYTV